jgi:mannose-1-phosphate guanylyltransferase
MGGMPKVHAIILCGGSGSRLWPRSRSKTPKHLLKLNGGATLVQETVRRIDLPAKQIYCVTEVSHDRLLRKQVAKVPARNIVVEPGRRGTASAIGLALTQMKSQVSDDDVVVVLPADSLIPDRRKFAETMAAWVRAAEQTERIVNLGVNPTYPSTGFGYINYGRRLKKIGRFDVFATERFVEKPNEATAKTYVDSGRYLWNGGMFAAPFKMLRQEMAKHLPELTKGLAAIEPALRKKDRAAVKRRYLKLPTETIDYGLLEKTDRLGVIPATFAWSDVGSWADLHDVLEHDADGNVFEGEYVDIDTKDCFVYSPDQLVATVGLSNLVIINTKDAVLICPKDRSQDVKKVVEKLKERRLKKYL